jgi:hypothetical protein
MMDARPHRSPGRARQHIRQRSHYFIFVVGAIVSLQRLLYIKITTLFLFAFCRLSVNCTIRIECKTPTFQLLVLLLALILSLPSTMPSILPTIEEDSQAKEAGPLKYSRHKRHYKMLSTKTADACLDWVIFPALLLIQFGATMYCQAQQGILTLDWTKVLPCLMLFCLVAGVYRQVLRRHPSESLFFLLLPELFTNGLLAMVMFGNLERTFEALILLTFVLLLVGGFASWHASILLQKYEPHDYQQLVGSEEEGDESEDEWIC